MTIVVNCIKAPSCMPLSIQLEVLSLTSQLVLVTLPIWLPSPCNPRFGCVCVFVKDTHSWGRYRWLQIYCLSVRPCVAQISRGSHNVGPNTELRNHALAKTLVPSLDDPHAAFANAPKCSLTPHARASSLFFSHDNNSDVSTHKVIYRKSRSKFVFYL